MYAEVSAPEGTVMTLRIRDSAMAWSLVREAGRWSIRKGAEASPSATVDVSRDDAWRLFYNAYDRDVAASVLRIEGDRALAMQLVSARSVMV